MFEQVKEILARYVNGMEITPDANLAEDLSMNSLDVIDFVIDIETAFKIKIPERKVQKLMTVEDFMKIIEELERKKIKN